MRLKNIGIVINQEKLEAAALAKELEGLLAARGLRTSTLLLSAADKQSFIAAADCLLVLGGDGTVLSVAAQAAQLQKPIVGVKLGRVGFLTDTSPQTAPALAESLAAGSFTVTPRLMLEGEINGERYLALNEICVQRASHERILRLSVYSGGEYVDAYPADGLLVATPTGSTAYSLSAGGPILNPSVQAMVLTPICAHTLRARPIVFSHTEELSLRLKKGACVSFVADGRERYCGPAEEILVRRAPFDALFLETEPRNFYKLLNAKLGQWSAPEGCKNAPARE